MYLQREYQSIKQEKNSKMVGKIERFETSRENKYEWTNAEKRKEKDSIEADYADIRQYQSKVNTWLEKIQQNIEEVERTYRASCKGYGSQVVSMAAQESILLIKQQLNWNGMESQVLESMAGADKETVNSILNRYEEYMQIVERASKDINLQEELISNKDKRREFTKSLQDGVHVNVNEAVKEAESKANDDSKMLSTDIII